MKQKLIDKALKKLLKTQESKIKEQGYDSVEDFISDLKKVPIKDLKAKEAELKAKKTENKENTQ